MGPIPEVGEHTEAILRELGYEESGTSSLRERGVT
jgi:crotonobetainyl-CoA:carnitine CoA-transferase CaiB-like acyl-CoA transferase